MNKNGMGPENRGMGTGRRRGNCYGRGKGRGTGPSEVSLLEELLNRVETLEKRLDREKEDLK